MTEDRYNDLQHAIEEIKLAVARLETRFDNLEKRFNGIFPAGATPPWADGAYLSRQLLRRVEQIETKLSGLERTVTQTQIKIFGIVLAISLAYSVIRIFGA